MKVFFISNKKIRLVVGGWGARGGWTGISLENRVMRDELLNSTPVTRSLSCYRSFLGLGGKGSDGQKLPFGKVSFPRRPQIDSP